MQVIMPHKSVTAYCKFGELSGTLSQTDKGIRSLATSTLAEGSQTTGEVELLNNQLKRRTSLMDDEIVGTGRKLSEVSRNVSPLHNRRVTISNDQVGFFATRRGDGQVGLANAFKIPRAA